MFDFTMSPIMKYAFVIANITKGTAFVLISITLIKLWVNKRKIMDSWFILLFSSFLILTSFSRFIDATLPFQPNYILYVTFLFCSGITALITAVILPSIIKKRMRLLTPEEYHDILNNLQAQMNYKNLAIEQKSQIIKDLESKIEDFESMRKRGEWTSRQQNVIDELRTLLRAKNV